jgi:RES domain
MARDLAVAVAACTVTTVTGEFRRHSSLKWPALTGSDSGGRWGRPTAYPVLYLGRPEQSVIVEAYRHLVDDVEGMRPDLVQPRRLVTCSVECTNILDLRTTENQLRVSLTNAELTSPVGDYERCQRVGAVAHQLGLHGVIAISASGLGETLALFEQRLPASELPVPTGIDVIWDRLPADPRRPSLRLIRDDES